MGGREKKIFKIANLNYKITLVYVFFKQYFFCIFGYKIYQFFTQSAPACKYLGLASHNPADLGESVVETISGRWLRAYGGFDHPNILGGVLAISLILVAYLLAKKKILNGSRQIWSSIFLFVFYFVGLYALFFSFSRAAWIALIVGLLVLLITLICFYDKWVLGRFIALIFFTLVLAGIVALPFQELVSARIEVETRLEQKSINDRYTYLLESRELLKNNFPFGVGIGNYHTALSLADNNKKAVWDYQPVHKFLFYVLFTETGLGFPF
jgi:O-antigen ligase